ncbi:MAG: hypothetical protein H7336_17400, partial [Bacteriovorax sp.]|nr:hypothetical protein [Bacteriovorax sp.]
TNKKQVAKVEMRFIANISNPLDLGAMIICVRALTGTHDFFNFYSSGSNVKSTIRTISTCELSVVNPHDIFTGQVLFPIPGDLHSCYQFKIEANGFLKQIIRHIVSALWMVGSGKISTDEFMTLLNGPANPNQLWKVAGPNGLFLYRVNYPD